MFENDTLPIGMMQPNDNMRPGSRGGTRPKSGKQGGGYKSTVHDTPGATVNVGFDPDAPVAPTLLNVESEEPPTTFLPPTKVSLIMYLVVCSICIG